MRNTTLKQITQRRADLVFDYVTAHAATSTGEGRTRLIKWCAGYECATDTSGMPRGMRFMGHPSAIWWIDLGILGAAPVGLSR